MIFEDLLKRDLDYPEFMDWPYQLDSFNNVSYINPKDKDQAVLYRRVENVDNIAFFYSLNVVESTKYFHKGETHREDGPAQIHKKDMTCIKSDTNYQDRERRIHYDIEWKFKGRSHRKNGPAEYDFYMENDNIENLTMKWFIKTNKPWNIAHRFNGPAYHRYGNDYNGYMLQTPKIIYSLFGRKYSEYAYWQEMIRSYSHKMPRLLTNNDTKMVFDINPNKPAPHVVYKNTKKLLWYHDGQKLPNSQTYWKITDNELLQRHNWLVLS